MVVCSYKREFYIIINMEFDISNLVLKYSQSLRRQRAITSMASPKFDA